MSTYGKNSQSGKLESIMNIDQNGISEWFEIEYLEKTLKFQIRGNGTPLLNKNRGLGTKYKIEKKYICKDGIKISEQAAGKIIAVRTIGFADIKGYGTPSAETLKIIKKQKCSFCGTGGPVEIDHKDTYLDYIGELPLEEFQPLCRRCNDLKRERCKKCKNTGKRFNALTLGYTVPFTSGNENFNEETRCKGCYFNDPREFRSKLFLTLKEY
jgi:hypothetical protein